MKGILKQSCAWILSILMCIQVIHIPVSALAESEIENTMDNGYHYVIDGINIDDSKTEDEAGETFDFYWNGSGKNITSDEAISETNIYYGNDNDNGIMTLASTMKTSQTGVDLIKQFEGCRLTAYKAVSTETYYTIGYGHYGADVYAGMTITEQEAETLLKNDLVKYEGYVNTFLNKYGITVTQNQFDALASFTYNLGNVWVSYDTFQLKTYLINGISNYTDSQITTAFTNWNKSGGVVLEGLIRRRNAEATLFLQGVSTSGCSCSVAYAGNYTVTTSSANLNMRSGHGSSYSIVTKIPSGATVYVSKASGSSASDWAHVEYNGYSGYCTMEYLSKTSKNHAPVGQLDEWSGGEQSVYVYGWAYDEDALGKSLSIHVYIGGPAGSSNAWGTAITANKQRTDVEAAYPGVGSYHGYNEVIQTSITGTTTIYVYAIDEGGTSNTLLGSKTVTITPYTISYNANGGSGAPSSQTKTYNNNITLSSTVPTRTGYTFAGWNTKADGSGTSYSKGAVYSGNGSATLYAMWTSNAYTVSYNANGGSGAPSSQTKVYGTALTLSSTIPTRFGYNFLGWSTSSTATLASYLPGGSFTTNANTTLYAVWSAAEAISTSLPADYSVNINIAGTSKYFKFTPSTSGTYQFESSGSSDTYVTLYNASGSVLAQNDDGGNSTNFLLTYEMTAGTTYYIATRMYSSTTTGTFSMTVSKPVTLKITIQPSNVMVTTGSKATFTVNAEGSGLTYQWYYKKSGSSSWTKWNGHTTASTSATSNNTWNKMQVRCVVTDSKGNTVTSNAATVTLKPVIITQPKSVTVTTGSKATFTVVADGSGLTYQWYYKKSGSSSWSKWNGHTTASTSATSNNTWNKMQVRCIVTDSNGNSVTSSAATITLKPVITAQPKSVTVTTGSTATFTVKADGSGLTYQWYYKKSGSNSWSKWNGHTTASTSATSNSTWDKMQVRCVVTDSNGNSVTSNAATITLKPVIITQPKNVTVTTGSNATFTVKADGSGLTYQWYYKKSGSNSWSKWNGHTTASTSATSNSTWDKMQVRCVVTDSNGYTVTSSAAIITIKPIVITTQPSNVTVTTGSTATFAVKASGSGLKYQWYYKKSGSSSWSKWNGHTTASTSATSNSTWNKMQVRCVVTDSNGYTVTSSAATVTLK